MDFPSCVHKPGFPMPGHICISHINHSLVGCLLIKRLWVQLWSPSNVTWSKSDGKKAAKHMQDVRMLLHTDSYKLARTVIYHILN